MFAVLRAEVIDIDADSYRLKEAKECAAPVQAARQEDAAILKSVQLFTGELHRPQARVSPVNFTEYPRFLVPINRSLLPTERRFGGRSLSHPRIQPAPTVSPVLGSTRRAGTSRANVL
jgi:hypothetical protein